MNKQYDMLIIGAGIIGTCLAFDLAKRGYNTLNIDKQSAAGFGSTANTCAVIRTHYSTFQGTALAYENHFYWKNWADYLELNGETDLAQYRETGIVAIKNEDSEIDKFRKHHKALGIPFEDWSPAQLKERLPFLDLRSFWPPKRPDDKDFLNPTGDSIPGAFYVPVGGYINDPTLSVHNVQQAAEAKGAEFLFKEEVCEIRQANDRVCGVALNSGQCLDAPVVINVAGPHSFVINEMAGVTQGMKIHTRALRHEVHYTPAPEGVDYEKSGMLVSDDDVGSYSRPEVGNTLLIGSQDPPCDAQEWVEDPDHYDREVTEQQWKAQVYRVAQRIPGLPIPTHPRGIVDLYDVSDDWIPIYDKSDLPGFYMAVGTSGNQYKNGPVVGQMMAALVDACENGHDHDNDPVTIQGKYTDAILDLGFYSRLREINKDSSFSVLG